MLLFGTLWYVTVVSFLHVFINSSLHPLIFSYHIFEHLVTILFTPAYYNYNKSFRLLYFAGFPFDFLKHFSEILTFLKLLLCYTGWLVLHISSVDHGMTKLLSAEPG